MTAFRFSKSSYSATAGECVEVALNVPGTVAVRDSKEPASPVLRVVPESWVRFLALAGRMSTRA
ncbi:DUF397 domain-containing protein [Streptomyces sp. NPDC052236]|uniref:DUF397 domain-containing protein n=1 Tax=Streptomyces sp. NPDC052236 TaxID=3365686 RepID=UPI0037D4C0F4